LKLRFAEIGKTKSQKECAGLLIGVILLVTLGRANAEQLTKPLVVTVTVIASCIVSIADTIPGHSIALLTGSAMDISNLVRGQCGKRTSLRVGFHHGSGRGTTLSAGLAGGNARDNSLYTRSKSPVISDDAKASNLMSGAGGSLDQKPTVNEQNQSGEPHTRSNVLSNVIRITIDL
jgi:spore coat protein U-like protein